MSVRCGLCPKFISPGNELRCTGPCGQAMHAKCVSKHYNVPLDDSGALMSSFQCGSCVLAPPSMPLMVPSLVVSTVAASGLVDGGASAVQRQSASPAFFSPGPEDILSTEML